MNILYIGPNDSEWAQMNRPVSLAAAKWARGFLTSLSKVANITALTHTYEVSWPKGDVFWRGYNKLLYPEGWDCVSISYPVIKYLRDWWYAWRYPIEAKRIVCRKNIDVAIFYNCHLPYLVRTMKVLHSMGVPCVPIILDGDDPRRDEWKWIKLAGQYANGMVSLSWWIYTHSPVSVPKYHMDGGADDWRGEGVIVDKQIIMGSDTMYDTLRNTNMHYFTLVHTGALDQWRGLNFMVEVVKFLTGRRNDVKFIFCGKSSCKTLERVFGGNPQVILPGFVTEEEMVRICNSADVLLNVRDPEHPDNILNYPSKLPHYLSFGRPIVSTRLESLSPDYDNVIEFPEENSVDSFVRKVEEVMSWSVDK